MNTSSRSANEYGSLEELYEGRGTLTFENGVQEECTFCAFQRTCGDIYLLAETESWARFALETPSSFEGKTAAGQPLIANGFDHTKYLREIPPGKTGVFAAFKVRQLILGNQPDEEIEASQFYIVNATLPELALTIEHPLGCAQVSRIPGYRTILQRLRTLKEIEITGVLDVRAKDALSCDTVADDMCYVLSLALGTKINWVVRDDYSSAGERIRRTHANRVTKPLCGLQTIDSRSFWQVENA